MTETVVDTNTQSSDSLNQTATLSSTEFHSASIAEPVAPAAKVEQPFAASMAKVTAAAPRPTLASVLVRNYVASNGATAKSSEWDDINKLASCIGSGVIEMHDAIDRNYGLLQQAGYTSPELTNSIETYTKDISVLSDDLMSIGALHEGRTGSAKDNTDYAESLDVFEKYRAIDVRLKSVILPVNMTITEALLEAREKALAEPEPLPDNIDPTVITDVVAKEPSGRGQVEGVVAMDEFGNPLVAATVTQ